MLEFARFKFERMKTAGDGASVEDHLTIIRQRAGFQKEVLEPECPREVIYVWNSWVELNGARGSSGFAPHPISWSELDAYSRMIGVEIYPWEARAIRAIDDAYLSSWAEDRGDGG